MSSRFFVAQPLELDQEVELDSQEAHHLIHVMRAKEGHPITLFNNTGWEFSAEIVKAGKKRVTVQINAATEISRETDREITIACPLPKSDRQKFMIEKLTELGVFRFIPINTQRSSVDASAKSIGKLERLVIEASKQCGRNRLMEIGEPKALSKLIVELGESQSECWLAHPPSRLAELELDEIPNVESPGHSDSQVMAIVGPEGGFSPDEVKLALDHSIRLLDLGKSILRMETATLACAVRLSSLSIDS